MRKWMVLAVVSGGALIATGCGSSKKSSASKAPSPSTSTPSKASGTQVKLKADPDGSLYFEPKGKQKAKAGSVTLVMTNPGSTGKRHGIGIQGNGLDKDGPIVAPGSTSTVTVSLKTGKYTFYCPVPGHRQAGMQGTLVVQ